jgi:hypothetical protein
MEKDMALVRMGKRLSANKPWTTDRNQAVREFKQWEMEDTLAEMDKEPFYEPVAFTNCTEMHVSQIMTGKFEVGQRVLAHWDHCPQDGCQGWIAWGTGNHWVIIVAIGTQDELDALRFNPGPEVQVVRTYSLPPYI